MCSILCAPCVCTLCVFSPLLKHSSSLSVVLPVCPRPTPLYGYPILVPRSQQGTNGRTGHGRLQGGRARRRNGVSHEGQEIGESETTRETDGRRTEEEKDADLWGRGKTRNDGDVKTGEDRDLPSRRIARGRGWRRASFNMWITLRVSLCTTLFSTGDLRSASVLSVASGQGETEFKTHLGRPSLTAQTRTRCEPQGRGTNARRSSSCSSASRSSRSADIFVDMSLVFVSPV